LSKKLQLTLATGDYEITRPLREGLVQPDGIELTVLSLEAARDRTFNIERSLQCDLSEFNAPGYFMARDRGYPITALPIYPHRRFRHGFVFVNTRKGIRQPSDLIGRKIGMGYFTPAANIWLRGLLEEHFGLPHRSVQWVTKQPEDIPFTPAEGLRIERDLSPRSLDALLLDGDIDALIAPSFPEAFIRGDERIARLFPNYQELEVAYYQQTGIFPIMHTLTIKQDLVERYPWVPDNLVYAFNEAKRLAYERVRNPRVMPLAWFQTAWEEQQRLLGPDPWVYGLGEANRKNLETIVRYTYEQGLISRHYALEDLFVPIPDSVFRGVSGY
jgi:4,5-dihydroxyphthalate decarboxylase